MNTRLVGSHWGWLIATGLSALAVGCGADAGPTDFAEGEVANASQALCAVSPLTIVGGSASSVENASFPANLAWDGNLTTRWSSVFADPQWIQVDLGATRYIDNIKLSWEAASALDYDVFVSTNGTDWTRTAFVHTSTAGARTDTLSGISARVARYVKVVGNIRSTQYGYSLYEIAVNGSTDPNCASAVGRSIGANLEAESNDGALGVQYETTTDTGGGQNAGWIDAGDYIEWQINVPTAGNYTVASRSATWGAASQQILIDGVQKSSLSLPATWTSGANQYQTWGTFTTPALALTAGTHTLRVAFGSANQNLNWVKVSPATAASSKVEMRVSAVDDFLYLSVDGVRRRVASWGPGAPSNEWRDITSYFHAGNNALRVQAANSGGPGALNVDFRVDGNLVTNITCPSATCIVPEDQAPFVDQAVTLPSLNLPAAQAITITSQTAGKIYLGDEYTGKSTPFTFQLPAGTYKVGVGVSNDTVGAFTGKYLEKTVTVSNAAQTIDMQSSGPGVGVTKAVKVGLLPVRTVVRSDLPAPGYLPDADIDKVRSQLQATSDKLLVPFSYGLSRWDITRLPTVTDVQPQLDGACAVLDLPQYSSYLTAYDLVVVLHSEKDANGNLLFGAASGGYSTGQCVSVANASDDTLGPNDPQQLFLHEILHQYEGNQQGFHYLYVGADGLHGSEEHGFPAPTPSEGWNAWYRTFIRGQAGELVTMRPGVTLQTPPANPSYYVGTFSSIKYGMHSPAPR